MSILDHPRRFAAAAMATSAISIVAGFVLAPQQSAPEVIPPGVESAAPDAKAQNADVTAQQAPSQVKVTGSSDPRAGQSGDTSAKAQDSAPFKQALPRSKTSLGYTPPMTVGVSVVDNSRGWPDKGEVVRRVKLASETISSADSRGWAATARMLSPIMSPGAIKSISQDAVGEAASPRASRSRAMTIILSDNRRTGGREAYVRLLRMGPSAGSVTMTLEFASDSPRIIAVRSS